MEDLQSIVQRMINAGESEENIALVIKEFNKPGKTTPTTPDAVVEETAASDQPSMELDSVDTSLELQPGEQGYFRQERRKGRSSEEIRQGVQPIPKKSKKLDSEDRDWKDRFKDLTLTLGKTVLSIPEMATSATEAVAMNTLNMGLKAFRPEFKGKDLKKPLELLIETAQDKYSFLPDSDIWAEEIDKLNEKISLDLSTTATEDITKGDYAKAAEKVVLMGIESLPSIAAAMGGYGGLVMLGAGTAGVKFKENLKNNPEKSLELITANAIGTGAIETGFNLVLKGIIDDAKKLIPSKGVNEAKKYLQSASKEIVKKIGYGFSAEAGEEAATELSIELFDVATLDKKIDPINLLYRLGDSFLTGGFVGGAITSIGQVGASGTKARERAETMLLDPTNKSALNAISSEISTLAFDLKSADEDGQTLIQDRINQLEDVVGKIKRQNTINLKSLDKKSFSAYANNIIELNKLQSIIKQNKGSAAKLAQEKFNILKKSNEELIDSAKKNRLENISKAAQKEAEKLNIDFKTFNTAEELNSFLDENADKFKGDIQKSKTEALESDGFIGEYKKDGRRAIFINKEVALKESAVNVAGHELLHGILFKTLKSNPTASVNLANSLLSEIKKLNTSEIKDSKMLERISLYQNASPETQAEEILTLFADATASGDISFSENIFTKIGDAIRKLLQDLGITNIKFNNGRDVYNFIKDYNKDLSKNGLRQSILDVAKNGAEGKLITEKNVINESEQIIKLSKSKEASDRVQKIYDEQGISGAFEIIEEFKPITLKITRKRREAPNYDEELLSSEIEIGQGGLLDLIKSYKPESGVPLAAYINKNLPLRAIAASKRMLGEQFTEDVTELRDIAVQEEISRKEEMEEREIAEEIKSLRKQIGLPEDLVARTKDAVMKTFGTKLPSPEDPKFKLALQTAFRVELKKPMAKFVGKQVDYENFLRDNFEVIYNKLTINTIAKRFRDFAEPVIDERTGKQAREKTDEGNKIFKKKNIAKAEFIAYFLGSNVGRSTQGTRKTAIVEAIAEEIAFDATMEVLRDPMVTERYLQISELIGDPLPENFKSLIAKQIDRGEDFKFSKSLTTKFSLTNQELANILINNTLLEIADGEPDIANSIFDEAFIRSFPATFKDIILPAYKKAINNADEALQIELGKSFIKLFSRPLRTFSYKGSEIKGEYNTNESVFNVLSDLLPDSLINENGFKLQKVSRGYSIFYNNEKIVDLFDVTQKNVLQRVIDKKITKEDFKKQNNHALYELKNLIFNLGESNPGLALSIIKLMQSDNRSIFRQAARLNAVVQNYSGELRYEHNPPVQHIFEQITDYLTNKTTEKRDKLDNLLNTMEANIVPKDFADIVDKKYKTKAHPEGLRYQEAINKTNYEFDSPSFKFSKTKVTEFNKIIERATGFKTRTKLAEVKADKLAKNKGKFRFFIPPSADDFAGLLYYITGKGEQGTADLEFFKETFFDPFAKGIAKFDESKQKALDNFKQLKKLIRKTPAALSKQNETGFTNEEVARIYIWNSLGYEIPGLTKKDIKEAVKFVKNNNELLEFAKNVKGISVLGYPKPESGWVAGTMTTDLLSYVNEAVRADFLKDWKTNVDATLKKPDVLNKLKATYGESYTEALEDILYRMETGRRRPMGGNKLTNNFLNWVSDSVGAIMFFNTRSALLQQLSFTNFLNFEDNNPIAAATAFANQKQFWKDYATLFNSDYLKQRRSGVKTDVNADEIAKKVEQGGNIYRNTIAVLLKKGFLPTQIADSNAIALGGASFYRNRIKKYIKEGFSEKEAEQKAFIDFQEASEETQQSSRPDRISMQQASPLGRVVLNFGNVLMQYNRKALKDIKDIIAKRPLPGKTIGESNMTRIPRILYYLAAQNIVFNALQSALFALAFSDEEEEKEKNKYFRIANGTADGILRGLGFGGAAVSVGKNMVLEAIKQYESGRPNYEKVGTKILSISPPIDSKIRKLQAAGRTFTYRQTREKIFTEGLSLDNPAFEAVGQAVSGLTNIPADRVIRKMDNLSTAATQDIETWQAISLALGYSKWDVGLIKPKTKKPKKPKTKLKVNKKVSKKRKIEK